jgi:hypothetical protein
MIINMVFRVTLDELFQVRIMKTSTSFILLTVYSATPLLLLRRFCIRMALSRR